MKDKILLHDVIEMLSANAIQIKLLTGTTDASGGYGWHTFYSVTLLGTVEYCPYCREKENKNYSDTAHPLNRHSWRRENPTLFYGEFRSHEKLVEALLPFTDKKYNQFGQ